MRNRIEETKKSFRFMERKQKQYAASPMLQEQSSQEYMITVYDAGKKKHVFSKKWTIFRVPALLRDVDEEAYTPKIVSIGPFHHNRAELKSMEFQKRRLLDRMIERVCITEQELVEAMKRLEETIKECYYEKFEENISGFAQMMVLDGCFIMELLRLNYEMIENTFEADDPIFATHWMLSSIRRDLLMLENQLPLFVLEEIFHLTKTRDDKAPLNELALEFFKPVRPGTRKMSEYVYAVKGDHPHLLGLFQSSFLPLNESKDYPRSSQKSETPSNRWLMKAKLLAEAGIKLRTGSGHLLDIKFKKNVLEIPTIQVYYNTNFVVRNMVAYEQCDRSAHPFFTCLVVFYNSIVDTSEDVRILREAGIIKHAQGSDKDVMNMINRLSKGVVYDESNNCYIADIMDQLHNFCNSRYRKLRIKFVRDYAPPMDYLSILLFYLALVQTFFAIFPYFVPSDNSS